MVKFLKNTFLVLAIVLFASSLFPSGAVATPADKVTICHGAGQDGTTKYITLTISWNAVYGEAGHFYENGTPRAGHEDDYLGACVGDPTEEPTEPPTEEPTETVTPTLPPTEEPTETVTPTLPPTEEPTETVTPTLPPTEEPTETVTPPPTEEPTETVTPTEVTEVPTETQVPTENPTEEPIVVLPLTGADNNSGGHSRTLFSFALGSLGMALVLAGVEKKLVLDK